MEAGEAIKRKNYQDAEMVVAGLVWLAGGCIDIGKGVHWYSDIVTANFPIKELTQDWFVVTIIMNMMKLFS